MTYLPKIAEIGMFRKKLGITRTELAKAIHVTSNMITQIESGRANPSAENYAKILKYLYKKSDENEMKLEEIMATPIIHLNPNQTAQDANKIFDDKGQDIDCLPVLLNDKHLVGKITRNYLEELLKKTNKKPIDFMIKDILEESPPTTPHDTPKTWITKFIQSHKDCVLVTKNGKIVGIVNYWDYLTKNNLLSM